jgi:ribosomal subunit interface protein
MVSGNYKEEWTMNFQIKCRHAECTEEMKDEIKKKMQRLLPLIPENTFAEMVLVEHAKYQSGGSKEAEVILDIPGHSSIVRFVCLGETFLEAVDRVLDKLDEHLTKLKDRATDHSYRGDPPKVKVADTANSEEIIP